MATNRADAQYLDHLWPKIEPTGTDHPVDRLAQSQDRARQAWADIHRTHTRRMADVTQTEAGRLVSSARFARDVLSRQRAEFEEARDDAQQALRVTRDQLRRALNPPSDPGEAALFADIRAQLRAMDVGKRTQVVMAAMGEAFDERILRAATSGPTEFALVQGRILDEARDAFLLKVAPNEWGREVRLREALETAEAGFTQLEAHARHLVDFATAEAAERSAA